MIHWSDGIVGCQYGMAWCKLQRSYTHAWDTCRRGEWMVWLLDFCDIENVFNWREATRTARVAADAAGPRGTRPWIDAWEASLSDVADAVRLVFPDPPVLP